MKLTKSLIVALLLILSFGGISIEPIVAQTNVQNTQVETAAGTIEGINNSGVYEYKGIPFAAPPVGELRWRPPQPVEPWQGIKDTKAFGPRCMQRPIFGDMVFRSYGMSEDCLYLNVWSPTNNPDAGLPVLVYFYGGGFMAGDGSEPRYDGENMARTEGIVTITVNYRLTVFGFMAHPELTAESPKNASGNYGLLDQAAALQWVRDNIAAFGGDPDKITIAGESAGSISVSAQMASPLSRDLLAGAVGESGSVMGTLSAVPLKQGEKNGLQFQRSLGKSSLQELRLLSADSLLRAMANPRIGRFSPTIDGYFFPKEPVDIYRSGEQADIPLMAGWNSREMTYQLLFQGKEPTPENYKEVINQLYPRNAQRILEEYPGNKREQVISSANDLAGDRFIGFSTWKWTDLHAETSQQPVFRYFYKRPRPATHPTEKNPDPQPDEGAVHSAEIEYLMGNLPTNSVYDWTPDDYKVSEIFQGFVGNFVRTGNPNGPGLPTWQPMTAGEGIKVMHIDVKTELRSSDKESRYELLNSIIFPGSQ